MPKYRYPLDYNPILEYWAAIESGKEVVSSKVHKWYQYLAWEVNHPGEYFYSPKRANHVLEFAENYCKVVQRSRSRPAYPIGAMGKAHLAAVFGFIDINGCRQCRESVLIVGKKKWKVLTGLHRRSLHADRGRGAGA